MTANIAGVLTTLNHALPSGVDAARLAQWRLRDGSSYMEMRNRIATEITSLNLELGQAWGDMFYITELDFFEYQDGGTLEDMKDTTELDRAESTKAHTVGHSIDLREKSDGIGGSGKFWRDVRQSVLDSNIDEKVQKGRQTLEKALLTRAMTNTNNAVGSGGTGYDAPFCDASATLTYTPPAYGGNTFTSSHNHYIGYNSDASANNVGDMLNGLAATVVHHGHAGNLIALVSESNIANYNALGDDWIKPTNGPVVIDRGGNTTGASFFSNDPYGDRPMAGSYYIGAYLSNSGRITVRATARIPSGYAFVYNTYGRNNSRNPIAIRIHPAVGFGFYMREIPDETTTYPIKQIDIAIEYGISVNKGRTNGAAGYLVSGGAWANPTIA